MREKIDHKLPKLKTITKDGMRYYQTPNGDKFYPSVTSVVKEFEDKKEALKKWVKRVGEEEAKRVRTKAATHGTMSHKMYEHYLNNEELVFNTPIQKEEFLIVKPEIDKIGNIHALEDSLYSDFLKVGGRVDVIGDYPINNRDWVSVIDFKTSKRVKKREHIQDYFMQEAAYAVAFEERTGIPCKKLVTIISVEQSDPIIFIEDRDTWIKPFMNLRKKFKEHWGI